MQEPPLAAIFNGREFIRRLEDWYEFECEAGSLEMCQEWQQMKQCFECMAEWIEEEGEDWEPSESQQGLIPIPEKYNEG